MTTNELKSFFIDEINKNPQLLIPITVDNNKLYCSTPIILEDLLKFISDINFNLVPNSFALRNNLDRRYSNRIYRFAAPQYATWENVKFIWLRDYNLNWDLTRSIKLNFSAQNEATVDEITYNPLRQSYVDPLSNELVSRAEKKPFLYKSSCFKLARFFKIKASVAKVVCSVSMVKSLSFCCNSARKQSYFSVCNSP